MAHVLTDLAIDEVSLVRRGADQDAHVVLYKTAALAAPPEEIPRMTLNPAIAKHLDGVDLTDEQISSLNAEFEARASAPSGDGDVNGEGVPAAEAAPVAEVADPGTPTEVGKSAEVVALEKRLEATEAELAKNRADVEKRDLVEKVKIELPALAIDADAVASVMFRLEKADRDAYLGILQSVNKIAAEAGTFVERGSNLGDDDADAFGKVVAKLMAETPGLSQPAAVSKALTTKEGRAAYVQRRTES